jgi:tetratricopeptide (TPR) repeat protein
MNIIMLNLAKPTIWLFFGLLTATSGIYAQEAAQKARQPAESAVRNPDGMDSYEQQLRDADALIKNGKPADAYALLEPLEFEHSGEERFDYLIGIAALDSGKPDKATLALERVLAVNPDSVAARLEIARAYYQLGDFPRAKTEFETVLKQNPTEAARANIEKYLDEIAVQESGKRTRVSGYAEAGIGHDSNVNSSTSQSQVFVDLNSYMAPLDKSNVKAADNYYAVAAGGEINHSLNTNWGLYAGADVRKRDNHTQDQFDSISVDARAGVTYEAKANRLRVSMLDGRYSLGGSHNNDATGFKAEGRHVFSPGNQLNVYVRSVQYRFADAIMQPNDIDQRAIGLGWTHVLADGRSTLSGSVHLGSEKDVAPKIKVPGIGIINPSGGRNDGASRFRGLRLGGQTAISDKTTLFVNADAQAGNFSKINYLFLRQRNDRLYNLTMGANWRWDKLWTLRPQLSYTMNDSNIAIYGYERMDVSLNVRRDFR